MTGTSKYLLGHVKVIIRELGHQLETEIVLSEILSKQTRKLQDLKQVYNKTDRQILSTAQIISGAALMELQDMRL
jgi:hypothetical protein